MRKRVGKLVGLALAAAVAAASATPAQADDSIPADALGSSGDQHISYPAWNSDTLSAPNFTVGAVGDVNGDGMEDIAAGFDLTADGGSAVYVTFSSRGHSVGDVAGFGGFKILTGSPRTNSFAWGVGSAGDVNGDGFGDIAITRTTDVLVVFGKPDSTTVDASALGLQGFTIKGAVTTTGSGTDKIFDNASVVHLHDLNGDGVDDLLMRAGSNATIVYPPRTAAGMTIDASTAGPNVSLLRAEGAKELYAPFVDTLGDINGDGRDDVLVAGEERQGTDQVAYGVYSPSPGTTVDLGSLVGDDKGFELRTHDGRDGWYGELEDAITVGDQNGDGRRDIALVGAKDGVRRLRVAFSPASSVKVDIDDLAATGSRGYAKHGTSSVIDVGDQNADGRGDFATSRFVYFTDPARETGDLDINGNGFYFSFLDLAYATVVAPLHDLNGDGKPELAVARAYSSPNCPSPDWCGENAWYAVDVFDSAKPPEVPPPDQPVTLPDGDVEVPADIGTGAGDRGGGSLAVRPRLELGPANGSATVAKTGGLVSSKGRSVAVALRIHAAQALGGKPLVPGHRYRVRYAARNGRGLASVGPWRYFVYRPDARLRWPHVRGLFAHVREDKLEIGFLRRRGARGIGHVCLVQAHKRRCVTRFVTHPHGSEVVVTALIRRLGLSGRWLMTVRFAGSGGWASQTRKKRVQLS